MQFFEILCSLSIYTNNQLKCVITTPEKKTCAFSHKDTYYGFNCFKGVKMLKKWTLPPETPPGIFLDPSKFSIRVWSVGRVFSTGEWGQSPPSPPKKKAKNLLIPPSPGTIPPPTITFFFNFILFGHIGHANFDFNQCFVFTKAVFSFEKGSNGQNHSFSASYHPVKNPHSKNFQFPQLGESLHPLTIFGKMFSACGDLW